MPMWLVDLTPVYELVLALWLLSGWCRFGSNLAGILTFAIFSIVNLTQIYGGQSECGCFGAVKVAPWKTLILDIGLVALLVCKSPKWAGWPTSSQGLKLIGSTAVVAILALAVPVTILIAKYGSVTAGLAGLNGHAIAVVHPTINVGSLRGDELIDNQVEIINLTEESVQVACIMTKPYCADFHNLPITLAPRDTVNIQFSFLSPKSPGSFRRVGEIKSSAGGVTQFEIVGHVVSD
jgi:hypothetical protein